MRKLIAKIKKHKIITVIVILILIGGGYYWYTSASGKTTQISYVTEAATKQTVITSVSGSGQMLNSNQVDLKPKVSGDIIKVAVSASQTVKQGNIIAQINASDAYKAVRDAQTSLESAQLSLDKLKQSATEETKFQAQNTLTSAQASLDKLKLSQPVDYQNASDDLQTANNNLDKAYSDALTSISNIFLNLPNIISSLNDVLYSDQISTTGTTAKSGPVNTAALLNYTNEVDQSKIKSYQAGAESDYAAARKAYDTNYQDFKDTSLSSDRPTVENLLTETLATTKAMAQAIKSQNNYLNAWSDSFTTYNTSAALRSTTALTQVSTYLTNLSSYTGQVNSAVTNLSNAKTTIESDKQAIVTANNNLIALKQNQPVDLLAAQNAVQDKKYALANLLAGADPLDIRNQQITVDQRRSALLDAQSALADYTIRAPFDGVIAAVNSKVGDPASSGTAIATIITHQQIAQISLNELDAAKIKVGQKVNLTFDAIDGLEITGKVAQIDAIGTVSQGVVSFTVQIVLDTQDQRVKAGMSVNTVIITNVKTDVLTVPNSAVKTNSNSGNYVQTLDAGGQPQNVTVQVGLADDTNTEITSGLNEGDKVITQTINSTGAAAAAQTGSTTNRSGGGFGGGGAGSLGGAATRVFRGN